MSKRKKKPQRRRYEKAPKVKWPEAMHREADRYTDGELYAVALHPAVAGLGCRPRAVSDEDWVESVVRLCNQYGTRAVFRDLLLLLRQTYELWKSDGRAVPPDVPVPKKTRLEIPLPSVFRSPAAAAAERWTEPDVRAMLCNPTVAGIGPYPQAVPDELWTEAIGKLAAREGLKQTLVNVLAMLRSTFGGGGFSSALADG
jgi:hypothetical protein